MTKRYCIGLLVLSFLSMTVAARPVCHELYELASRKANFLAGFSMAGSGALVVASVAAQLQNRPLLGEGFLVAASAGLVAEIVQGNLGDFTGLLASTIAEARTGEVGFFAERAAEILNRSILRPDPRRALLGGQFHIPKASRQVLRVQMAGRQISPSDILSATRILDANNNFCLPDGKVISVADWASMIVTLAGAPPESETQSRSGAQCPWSDVYAP